MSTTVKKKGTPKPQPLPAAADTDRKCPLFRRHADRIVSTPGKIGYYSWNLLGLLLASLGTGLACLLLSVSNYSMDIFKGYFECSLIVVLNMLLPVALSLFFFGITGRSWLSYLLSAVPCLLIALGNYFLIAVRNDPLQFEDILCLREALAITEAQHYELHLGWQFFTAIFIFLGNGALLFFFFRWTPKFLHRCGWIAAGAIIGAIFLHEVVDPGTFNKTKHYDHIDTWSSTQIYISRGCLYSFCRDMRSSSNSKPEGYTEAAAKDELAKYTADSIPEDRKVNVIAVMRESYCDLSKLDYDKDGLDMSCYDYYHSLEAEGYSGTLITNGFGGNTKDAERCFLTGDYVTPNYRKPANSYVWYLRTQGYLAEGTHTFNGWFYNRSNINSYLGFNNYYFKENLFAEVAGEDVRAAEDDVQYGELLRLFNESDPSVPYFSFNVTYEGHGPYSYTRNSYKTQFVLRDAKTPDGYAMNNYLSCVYQRDQELKILVDALRESDRPVVLLLYGDHKATIGSDINNYATTGYAAYGINVDKSPSSGDAFLNYYSTQYLIWANDAAKKALGTDFAGQTGPTVSPCFLMNVLFDALDWGGGPEYMQAMDKLMDIFPVYSQKGVLLMNGEPVRSYGAYGEEYSLLKYIDYYWKDNFFYEDIK